MSVAATAVLPGRVALDERRVRSARRTAAAARAAGRRGGQVTFSIEEAYREHAAVLLWFAMTSVGDRSDAEDLVQEVFTRAWRAAGQFDPTRASLRTWLFAIARNLVLDTYRSRSRRPVPADGVLADRVLAGGELEGGAPALPGPEEEVVRRTQVVEAVACLSPEHREVVVAVHLQGRTYAELSQLTGTAVATLRTRMHYGLRAMRSALDEAGWRDDG